MIGDLPAIAGRFGLAPSEMRAMTLRAFFKWVRARSRAIHRDRYWGATFALGTIDQLSRGVAEGGQPMTPDDLYPALDKDGPA